MRAISSKTAALLLALLSHLPDAAKGAPTSIHAVDHVNSISARSPIYIPKVKDPAVDVIPGGSVGSTVNDTPDNVGAALTDDVSSDGSTARPDDDSTTSNRGNSPASTLDKGPVKNPGVGETGFDREKILPMDQYQSDGTKALNDYIKAITSNKAETKIAETQADADKLAKNTGWLDWTKNPGYKPDYSEVDLLNAYPGLKLFDRELTGFDIPNTARQVITQDKAYDAFLKKAGDDSSKKGDDQEGPAYCNRGTYDPDGRFIVFQDAFKANNDFVENHVPLNEIGMQNILHVAGDKAKNLQGAFLTDIQNEGFWAIVRQNYRDMGKTFADRVTFAAGSKQFQRLMGSPNFKSKLLGMSNHHNALGNKVPISVTTAPKQVKGSGGQLNVFIKFGPYTAPK